MKDQCFKHFSDHLEINTLLYLKLQSYVQCEERNQAHLLDFHISKICSKKKVICII